MASYITEQMKKALLGNIDQQGEEQMGLLGYLAAPGQYLRGGLSDAISWLPGGVPAHGFTGRKMWGDEVLQEHGMVNKPGLDATDVLGFGMDMVVDPLNLFMGAGLAKGGVKLARMLPKLASKAGRAESLAAAKTALGAVPGALKRHAAPLGLGIGGMFGGGALMANNPEGSDWKDLLGMGMMTAPLVAPLAMAAGRRARPTARGVLQPETATAPVASAVPKTKASQPIPGNAIQSAMSQADQKALAEGKVIVYTASKAPSVSEITPQPFYTHDRNVIFASNSPEHAAYWAEKNGGTVHKAYLKPGKTVEVGEFNNEYESLNGIDYDTAVSRGINDAGFKIDEYVIHDPTRLEPATTNPSAGKPLRKWSKKSVAEAIAAEDAKAVQAAGPPTPAYYFNEKALKKAEASGTLTYMHPRDFLAMAYPFSFGEQNPVSSATVKKLLESKTPFNTLPELSVQRALQGQSLVTGHEGRHRAQALLDLGVEEMPVVIKMKKGETPQGKLRSQRVENPPVIDFPQLRQASAVLQPGEHGVIPISRPEIDFLEQLGIRDATKWQEIKRLLGGADARTPEAQAVVEKFLPARSAQELFDEQFVQSAGKTARPWKTTTTYKTAVPLVKPGMKVVDYGSGPYQSVRGPIEQAGGTYVPFDRFGGIGSLEDIADADMVMASNVLNVQSKAANPRAAYDAVLAEIASVMKPNATLVANMPSNGPRSDWMSPKQLMEDLNKLFSDVSRSGEVVVARNPRRS